MAIVIRGHQLRRGERVRDRSASRVLLDDCWTEQGAPDEFRPCIERVTVDGLSLKRSSLGGAVLRDVTVRGLRTDSSSAFLQANEYERVTFTGHIPSLVISARLSYPPLADAYRAALTKADNGDSWSIDISQAIGAIEVRGYSADRLRLHPDRHGVVRRRTLEEHGWTDADVTDSSFAVDIRLMLEGGWNDAILVADPTNPRHEQMMTALRQLKDLGIAH
jgi:hypothetical protein